jgi:hypothetical protein
MSALAWLWHTVFDGTWVCRCEMSQIMRRVSK